VKTYTLKSIFFIVIFALLTPAMNIVFAQTEKTYAEKLGWKQGEKVIILHIDDAGMSYDSNLGTIKAMEEGVANSVSVMMPCPWVPGFVKYLKQHPSLDAGLHLTLTAEWRDYRWGPLTGKGASPGLVDKEGAFWPNVASVVQHASPDEVEAEIRAQLARAREMGFEPTHMDSHMGTLFASPQFMERYIKVGIEQQIPVMLPGGHNTAIFTQLAEEALADGKIKKGQAFPPAAEANRLREAGRMIWQAGLPVLDDLHNTSLGWKLPAGVKPTDENLQKMKTEKYIQSLKSLKPGVTMVIMHCTSPTEVFQHISSSGDSRKGDMLAMIDPALKKAIQQEGIILTTWRELKQRRDKAGK
jgi:predicted glycoside hydrolase/deacetylase ChbG (UPF0249 family)